MIFLSAFADEAGTSLKEQISALKKNQISYIEIRSIDDVNVLDFTIEKAKEYAKTLFDNGIYVYSIGSPIGKVDIDCDFNEYLVKFNHILDLCDVFSCKRIRMFSFFNSLEKPKKVVEHLKTLVKIASKRDIKLCHENEKGIFGDTIERVKYLMENVKGLGFVYDPANYLQVGEKAEDTLREFFDKTEYFHIKDVISETEEIVPAGYGDGQIEKIISLISKDTICTLEPHLKEFGAYKDIDDTELKNKFTFNSNAESFDFAVKSMEKILENQGYKKTTRNGVFGWEK